MRVRVWIDGQVRFEDHFPPSDGDGRDPAAYSVDQMRLIVDADAAGELWLIEIYDPNQGPDQHPFRFGTDAERMEAPIELPSFVDHEDGSAD